MSSLSELPTPVPSKLVLARKPVLSHSVSERSASAAATAAHDAWTASVRLVACGNFQEDTSPHMLENSSSNPSQEVFRLLLSMLARHFGWTAMVLDISCAFLNALLDEKVFIRPPPVLARLGLLFPNTLWLALRAIYGLRKSPKLWEEERNKTLNNRVLHLSTGTVIMETIETGTWILKSENECVGLFMMYVDDGLVVAKPELLKTLGVELKSLWALKFQGVLCGGGLADGDTLTIDDVTLPVQKGAEFSGNEDPPVSRWRASSSPNPVAGSGTNQARVAAHEGLPVAANCSRRHYRTHAPQWLLFRHSSSSSRRDWLSAVASTPHKT